jgi:rhodanese-related sulfurtransferase
VHAPGGQLIQATDQWVGVRNARIVLLDGGENVRAPVVASWLKQLGCDVYVLEGGVKSGLKDLLTPSPHDRGERVGERGDLPDLATISTTELKQALDAGRCTVFDLGQSMNFRKAHIPDSRWSTRVRLAADARKEDHSIVLVAGDTDVARLAAVDLLDAGITDVKLLNGGLAAWAKAGYATEASPEVPPDSECIDYLFFVHDRHAGNREAMKQYLAWETGLMAQLDEQDKASFKVGAEAVRDKLAAAGIADQDVQNAVKLARHKSGRTPKHD